VKGTAVEGLWSQEADMSTRAEQFKAASQRTHHLAPTVKKPHRPLDPMHTDTRNVKARNDKESGMALEDSMSGRPSRKSTRTSAHHGRNDNALMRTALAKSETPKAQAGRSKVARRK
jgi:hypothetical protein